MSSRDAILNKLRAAKRPFEDAPPRPKVYVPVINDFDTSPDALIERFSAELVGLKGDPFVVEGEDAARACVIDRLKQHQAARILAWHFTHIPVKKLREAIEAEGIEIIQPDSHDEFRAEILSAAEGAQVGLTGVENAIAATGTLIVRTGAGRGRIPTVLAPVHLAVLSANQILPRLENWIAIQRTKGINNLRGSANVCFISGPSRTGDIEMELILGVHGPGRVEVIIKK